MKKIERQLKNLKKSAGPSREFKATLFSKLSQSFDETYATHRTHSPFFRFAAVGITAMALFVSTGAGVYAYESPDVVEGHPLHFVKSGLEQVEGKFAVTPEERARYHAKMMGRRIAEAERHKKNVRTLRAIAPKIAEELDLTREELRDELLDPTQREALLLELSLHNERYAEVLGRVMESEEELRENRTSPLRLPPPIQKEMEALRLEIKDQDLAPDERREYIRSHMVPFLIEYQAERLNRMETLPRPSTEQTTEIQGTVLPEEEGSY